ncbi:hypothetical protein SynBIOSE41_01435 [Synechococcus sp. BIOS-E4-1]|uniref:hypothetical protein n=1 Tax=unclassified Synechococcus TaxID=2626047 RepID=UPI0007BB7D01|nr:MULTISPECIES: hypothetical protein [unclassified Synechococcus]KZR82858.1 hypothetical protein MITS9504_03432 [Synechococcus sp. MIT S9504]QNI53950.1 hypothetical protein SynBIOSE41_01435 [Synechococcus sp. BIOS-E4-1]
MSPLQTINRYLVRYRDLSGATLEGCVYASDAMEARDLAREFTAELRQRPNLIRAILRVH